MSDAPRPPRTEAEVLRLPLRQLRALEPDLWQMLQAMHPDWPDDALPLAEALAVLNVATLRENGLTPDLLRSCIRDFLTHLPGGAHDATANGPGDPDDPGGPWGIRSLTILGGRGKSGAAENVTLELRRGEVIALVGPTGAGKSRLLCDLECLAQGDTPTGRRILLDGAPATDQTRFSIEHKLVAQLTQNMNFVMDIPAGEFLLLHARSRLKPDPDHLAAEVIRSANALAGEPFTADTPLTGLSGGQSRALMIADTALICDSPVVLIDEIENAGVDRRKALELLVGLGKIVILATHDPVLALLADRRVTILGGAIAGVSATTPPERTLLEELLRSDERLSRIRAALRAGTPVDVA